VPNPTAALEAKVDSARRTKAARIRLGTGGPARPSGAGMGRRKRALIRQQRRRTAERARGPTTFGSGQAWKSIRKGLWLTTAGSAHDRQSDGLEYSDLLDIAGGRASARRLHGLAADMSLVSEFLKRMLTLANSDHIALKAYLTAALIIYRRCFSSGVRASLSDSDVEALPSNSGGVHSRVRAQASKFAAHSVNPFDLVKVGIMVKERTTVVGVGLLSAQLVGLSANEFKNGEGLWRTF